MVFGIVTQVTKAILVETAIALAADRSSGVRRGQVRELEARANEFPTRLQCPYARCSIDLAPAHPFSPGCLTMKIR